VFSTPVIGPDEQLYVGSADRSFYRFDPVSGETMWRYRTAEIIDSAAALAADGTVWVPGGDGRLFGLDMESGELRWQYDRTADPRYSPSTIYWWEGNVVVGPNGWLYAGNDDFFLYAIEPGVGVRWSVPTGLHIWAAPAFDDERVFAASFDRCLYALDPGTGRRHWSRDLGNFLASTPAVVGPHVVVGTLGGEVVAVERRTGRVAWRTELGGPVYASVAASADTLYVGAADGAVHALDARTGAMRWSRQLSGCIRGSAAVVGDQVLVPDGDGRVVCLDTWGARLWSYDTRVERPDARMTNLNASIAVGRHGIATASANGDVIYLPWGLAEGTPGLTLGEPPRQDGVSLWPLAAGGSPADQVEIGPGDVAAVQVRHVEEGQSRPVRLISASIDGHSASISPDATQVNLIDPPERPWLDVRYTAGGVEHRVRQQVPLIVRRRAPATLPRRFRIQRMSVQSPSIVPSFDQVGLSSLHIDVAVLEQVGESVLAWGVQRFGLDADGGAVGVPEGRVLQYPMLGTWRDGSLVLEARRVLFEITAFPVFVDRLRFVAHTDDGTLRGSSLLAEVDARSPSRFLGAMARPVPMPRRPRDVALLARVLRRALPLGAGLVSGMIEPWGLLRDGIFTGVGSFEVGDVPLVASSLRLCALDASGETARARFVGEPRATDSLGLLFLDGRGRPVGSIADQRRAGLQVMAPLQAGTEQVVAMLGHEPVATVASGGRPSAR